MTLVIGGKMARRRQSFCAFGSLPDPVENRQQIDVGECEPIIDEIAGRGDGPVENLQLLANRRHHGFDPVPISGL